MSILYIDIESAPDWERADLFLSDLIWKLKEKRRATKVA